MLFVLLFGLLVLICSTIIGQMYMTVATWSYRPGSIDKWFVFVAQWLATIVGEALVVSPLNRALPMALVSRCLSTWAVVYMSRRFLLRTGTPVDGSQKGVGLQY